MSRGAAGGLTREDLLAWIELRSLPALSDRRRRDLLARHGSAAAVLSAPAEELGEAAAAARGSPAVRERAERGADAVARLGIEVLTLDDPRFPACFAELHDPPSILFARGRLELLERPAVAVVGSRRHTGYGAEAARMIAGGLARAGVVVVSGLARGIDAVAHEAALEGGTVAVLGCGVDVVYPHANARLHDRIAEDGLLLSEFAPGEPALRHHFPQRNRLIAALARGVVVVEASARSGSLITAEHATDLGRDVFAVPGPIGRETSAGTNALIRDGAALVTGADDVLEALGMAGPVRGSGAAAGAAAGPPPEAGPALALWTAIGPEPLHADDLAERSGLSAPVAAAALLELELQGRIRQLPGMRFVRAR